MAVIVSLRDSIVNGKYGVIPQKGIVSYTNSTTPPQGWLPCDGTSGTPDLRDRFVVGYGSSITHANALCLTHNASNITLTDTNLPPHDHCIIGVSHTHSVTMPSSSHSHSITVNTQATGHCHTYKDIYALAPVRSGTYSSTKYPACLICCYYYPGDLGYDPTCSPGYPSYCGPYCVTCCCFYQNVCSLCAYKSIYAKCISVTGGAHTHCICTTSCGAHTHDGSTNTNGSHNHTVSTTPYTQISINPTPKYYSVLYLMRDPAVKCNTGTSTVSVLPSLRNITTNGGEGLSSVENIIAYPDAITLSDWSQNVKFNDNTFVGCSSTKTLCSTGGNKSIPLPIYSLPFHTHCVTCVTNHSHTVTIGGTGDHNHVTTTSCAGSHTHQYRNIQQVVETAANTYDGFITYSGGTYYENKLNVSACQLYSLCHDMNNGGNHTHTISNGSECHIHTGCSSLDGCHTHNICNKGTGWGTTVNNVDITVSNVILRMLCRNSSSPLMTSLRCSTSTGLSGFIPPKGIIAYAGSTTPPLGWLLCDGTNGTPDLRGRFILNFGATHMSCDLGKSNVRNDYVLLDKTQLPQHDHSTDYQGNHGHVVCATNGSHSHSLCIFTHTHTHSILDPFMISNCYFASMPCNITSYNITSTGGTTKAGSFHTPSLGSTHFYYKDCETSCAGSHSHSAAFTGGSHSHSATIDSCCHNHTICTKGSTWGTGTTQVPIDIIPNSFTLAYIMRDPNY
jgi:microcystin-dependent protein